MDNEPSEDQGQRIAIIIGCKSYSGAGLDDLQFAEKDAKAIEDRLRDPEIGKFDKIYSFDSGSSLKEIQLTTDQVLDNTRSEDKVVFYFSGHGIKHQQNGQLYLAIRETIKKSPRYTAISANALLEQLESAKAARKCVILDCCYSGAFGRKSGKAEMLNFEQDLKPHQGRGVIVLASSKEYEESLESDHHGHSLFTHYLLEGMDGAADEDADGVITPSELYRYAFDKVQIEADGEMSPKMPLYQLEGPEFYLVQNPQQEHKTLDKLQQEVEQMMSEYHHLAALEKLEFSIETYSKSPTRIRPKLEELKQSVESDLCEKWRTYLSRLNSDWAQGLIGIELKDVAEQQVKGDPEFMFSDKFPDDPLALDLRQHFKSNIESSAFNERWPRERLFRLINRATAEIDSVDNKGSKAKTASGDSVNEGDFERIQPMDQRSEKSDEAMLDPVVEVAPPEEAGNQTIVNRIKNWSPILIGVVVIFVVVISMPIQTPFDPNNVKLGINARSSSGDELSRYILSEFRDELNKALSEKGSRFKLSKEIKEFENIGSSLKELTVALKQGNVDILGELSPYEIFKLNEEIEISPFIGPKHSVVRGSPPQSSYRTILFGLANDYSIPKSQRPDRLINEIGNGKKIVVSNKESTSGYWWPREWVIERFRRTGVEKSFEESSVIQDQSRKIIKKVICDPGRTAAGALAEFRYRAYVNDGSIKDIALKNQVQNCGASQSRKLKKIDELDEIPNGAYVLGPFARAEDQLEHDLIDVWQGAIAGLLDRSFNCKMSLENCDLKLNDDAITPEKIKNHLPEQWVDRNIQVYAAGDAGNVFQAQDEIAVKKSRTIFRLMLICVVILAVGLIAAILLRRSHSQRYPTAI